MSMFRKKDEFFIFVFCLQHVQNKCSQLFTFHFYPFFILWLKTFASLNVTDEHGRFKVLRKIGKAQKKNTTWAFRFGNKFKENSPKKILKIKKKKNASPLNWTEMFGTLLYWDQDTLNNRMDGWKQKEGLTSHWEGSNNGIGAPEANPTGKVLQQAWNGSRGAGCWGLEAHGGAVGCQEDFPHRLQTSLTLRGEGAPGAERRRKRKQKSQGAKSIFTFERSKKKDNEKGELGSLYFKSAVK